MVVDGLLRFDNFAVQLSYDAEWVEFYDDFLKVSASNHPGDGARSLAQFKNGSLRSA